MCLFQTQWLKMNSFEFSSAQKMSSSASRSGPLHPRHGGEEFFHLHVGGPTAQRGQIEMRG